jgi:hypothetical protein
MRFLDSYALRATRGISSSKRPGKKMISGRHAIIWHLSGLWSRNWVEKATVVEDKTRADYHTYVFDDLSPAQARIFPFRLKPAISRS